MDFGPLNGVRTALVIGAAVCALVALVAGYPIVTVVLSAGIAAHGGLWRWLWQQRRDTR
jgi:type III secretory pathway component EscV